MSASTADQWRLACHSLLRPSPWYELAAGATAASDDMRPWQERERARQARLDRILGHLDDDALERVCVSMREAYDAHIPGGMASMSAISVRVRMVHPLSAEHIGTMDARAWERWFAQEEKLLDWLEAAVSDKGGRDVPEEVYRRLWRRVMTAEQPAPGSLWLTDHDISAHRSLTAALAVARACGDRPALLVVHVGPVQGFIASARRIHDLWIGSYTVAYLSLRVAVDIAERCGPQAVVLPALVHLPAATPLLFSEELHVDSGRSRDERFTVLQERLRSSLSNKIVAVVPRMQGQSVAEQAMKAASSAWMTMAETMKCHLEAGTTQIDAYLRDGEKGWQGFRDQLDAHLELDAVLQPWPESLDDMRARLERLELTGFEALTQEDEEEPSSGAAYGDLYNLAHRTLAAHRKALAPAWPEGDERPKCSQCGQREQMGPVACNPYERRRALDKLSVELDGEGQRESLQLTRGEALCAVCLTKRFAPRAFYATDKAELGIDAGTTNEERRRLLAFPSTYSIASAPFRWRLMHALEGWPARDRVALQRAAERWVRAVNDLLREDCLSFTPPGNLLPGLSIRRPPVPAEVLTLDGQWFYESSYQAETAWLDHYPERDSSSDKKKQLEARLPIAFDAYRRMREQISAGPSSYYAVLRLDGDQMGKWLTGRHPDMPRLTELVAAPNELQGGRPLYPALHGELSRRLAGLALALHDLVETTYLGRVVYSGGDDLLAFLPVQTALPCLRAVERLVRSHQHLGSKVTVSAGLVITHVRAPLSLALREAHAAEEAAKKSAENGSDTHEPSAYFAVHVLERSGAPLRVTLPWRITSSYAARRDPVDTIATLWLLLDPREAAARGHTDPLQSDSNPLLRLTVARRLEAELAELGGRSELAEHDDKLTELFRERVRTLLAVASMPTTVRAGFEGLLETLTPGEMVDLVLMLRFLAREDRDVDAHDLCSALEAGRV